MNCQQSALQHMERKITNFGKEIIWLKRKCKIIKCCRTCTEAAGAGGSETSQIHKGIPHLHSGIIGTGGCRDVDLVLWSKSPFTSNLVTASEIELILSAEGPSLSSTDLHQIILNISGKLKQQYRIMAIQSQNEWIMEMSINQQKILVEFALRWGSNSNWTCRRSTTQN